MRCDVPRSRKHHNNTGFRQIRDGRTAEYIRRIAKKLGIPYKEVKNAEDDNWKRNTTLESK